MDLLDFEDHIDPKIVARGLGYFDSESVHDLEKIASGTWQANVKGSENYTVEVRTHRNKVKSWDCTCPYDYGPLCKHVVAVLYTIAEKTPQGNKMNKAKQR